MPVSEVVQALGSWDLTLKADTPKDVLDSLTAFGHVAVVAGRVDPRQVGDGLLGAARYVGVLKGEVTGGGAPKYSGFGMAMWLGLDERGDFPESAIDLNAASFTTAINALLPDAVTAGTIHAQPGTLTHRFQWETPKKSVTYVCETFGSGGLGVNAVEWRVNADATVDAGKVSELYVTNPRCIITRKGGYDHPLRGMTGKFSVARDVEDFTSRLVLMGQGTGVTLVTAAVDNASNPYVDLLGNPVAMKRIVSESDTPPSTAAARAAVMLAEFSGTNDALTMSTSDYDVTGLDGADGTFSVGDMVWAYDPESGLVDTANEVVFRGDRINPVRLRVTEATWPITKGNTVAYRAGDGTWIDLTDYVEWETSDTRLVVGSFKRPINNTSFEPVSWRPAVDTSVPGVPVFTTPFVGGTYLDGAGLSRARIRVQWSAPLNTDGSVVLDGDHYEIRYRIDDGVIYQSTWADLAAITWADWDTWAEPIDYQDGAWQVAYAAWGTTEITLQDLSPGVAYDFQIRAVDQSANAGAWSSTQTNSAAPDTLAPSDPAAPTVAASRIAVQVTHTLGKATGGTFNLESDLDHLDVHVSNESTFMPSSATLVGRLRANAGMMLGGIAAVATFQVESVDARYVKVIAVDQNGNASNASAAASATALLIDNAHISDLTVSKVTAGTISADWIVGARVATALTGARVELSSSGLLAYDAAGTQTVTISSADGSVDVIGRIRSGPAGDRVDINPPGASYPEIRFYPTSGSTYTRIYSVTNSGRLETRIDTDSWSGYRSAVNFNGSYVQMQMVDIATSLQYGGFMSIAPTQAQFGVVSGPSSSYFQYLGTGATLHTGTWGYNTNSDTGLIMDLWAVASATSSDAITYGATYASNPAVLCTLDDLPAAGATRGSQTAGRSTSGFTAYHTGATNGSHSVSFWAFRI